MKKNLILTTALFAGTMLISNDICANNIINPNEEQGAQDNHEQIALNAPQGPRTHKRTREQIDEQEQEENADENLQAPIDEQDQDQEQEQGNLERGAINSNFGSVTPTESVLKLREEIGQLFEKTQIKELERYNHDLVQNIKHNIMISNNEKKLKFAIEQVEEFLKITTEYGYESLQPEQKQYIFYKIFESHDPCEVNLTHVKTIGFLRIANMNGYENITNDEKKEILKNIFKDIFNTNDFQLYKVKVQQIIEKYNLN